MSSFRLNTSQTANAKVEELVPNHWRLTIPTGEAGIYRLAQLDDYKGQKRVYFPHKAPIDISVEIRASGNNLPGTWGIGLWNDPFGFNLGFGGNRILPALPNAAWFFFASEPNYLSFRDDYPANGKLAGTFRSPSLPSLILPLGLPVLPLLAWPITARMLRKAARQFVKEDANQLEHDTTEWHSYRISWAMEKVIFYFDGTRAFQTPISPRGPLGLVVWVDNQYAAFHPDGKLSFGTLPNKEQWIEFRNLEIYV
ncbi:MAG: family 16 glycosylhydrolase [Chloroflexota bacterium]